MSFFSILFALQFQAQAAPQIEVDVQSGFENIQKTGKALPVTIELTNSGSLFKGDVVLNAAFDSSGGSAVAKTISLKKGETKKVELILDKYYANDGSNKVKLFEGGWQHGKQLSYLGKGVVPTPKLNEGQLAIVSIGLPNNVQNKLLGVLKSDEQIVYKNSTHFKMPDNALALDAISMLIVHDNSMSTWTTADQKNLLQWINKGGTLLVDSNVTLPKPLQEKAPLQLGGNTQLLTTQIAKQYFKSASSNLKIYSATLNDKATITMGAKNEVIMAKKQLGDGAIVQTTFELTEANLGGSESSQVIVDQLVDQIEQKDESMYGDMYTQLVEGTTIFPAFHLSSWLLISILLAYILVIAPLLYVVLKKTDKREYAWWIIPIGALMTAIIIFGVSSKGRLTSSKVQQASVINIGNTTTDIFYAQSLLSNKAGDLTITAPNDVFMTRYMTDNSIGDFAKSAIVQQGEDKNKLHLLNTRYWGVTSVLGNFQQPNFGKLAIDVHVTKGRLVGTVKNNLDEKIVDASIWSDYTKIKIGDIAAGETIKIDKKVKQQFLMNAKSLEDFNEEMPTDKEKLKEYQKKMVENSAIASVVRPRTPLFIGWMEKSVVPLQYDQLKVKKSSQNLVVQGFEEDIVLDDDFTLQDGNFEIDIRSLTDEGYADITDVQTGWVVDNGSYTISYKLARNISAQNITWQELHLRFNPQPNTSLSIYNQRDNSYEKIDDKQTTIKHNINNYMTPAGEILFKLKREDIVDPTMKKPMIQLKGAANK